MDILCTLHLTIRILILIQSTKLVSTSSFYQHSRIFSFVQFHQHVQLCTTTTVKVHLRRILTGPPKSPLTKKKEPRHCPNWKHCGHRSLEVTARARTSAQGRLHSHFNCLGETQAIQTTEWKSLREHWYRSPSLFLSTGLQAFSCCPFHPHLIKVPGGSCSEETGHHQRPAT